MAKKRRVSTQKVFGLAVTFNRDGSDVDARTSGRTVPITVAVKALRKLADALERDPFFGAVGIQEGLTFGTF